MPKNKSNSNSQSNNQKSNHIITEAHESNFDEPFTMIPNSIHDHKNLSPLTKLLMWHLLRQIPGWKFIDKNIMKFLGCGVKKLEYCFRELRLCGYVKIVHLRAEDGKTNAGSKRIFCKKPIFLETSPQNLTPQYLTPQDLTPQVERGIPINNTKRTKTILNNTDSDPTREITQEPELAECITKKKEEKAAPASTTNATPLKSSQNCTITSRPTNHYSQPEKTQPQRSQGHLMVYANRNSSDEVSSSAFTNDIFHNGTMRERLKFAKVPVNDINAWCSEFEEDELNSFWSELREWVTKDRINVRNVGGWFRKRISRERIQREREARKLAITRA